MRLLQRRLPRLPQPEGQRRLRREPGCGWWAPPACDTWTGCVVLWLESGGCEELARQPGLIGYGGGDDESVTFADYCP